MRLRLAIVVFALGFGVVAPLHAGQGPSADPALKKAADARTAARDAADAVTYGSYTLDDAWILPAMVRSAPNSKTLNR